MIVEDPAPSTTFADVLPGDTFKESASGNVGLKASNPTVTDTGAVLNATMLASGLLVSVPPGTPVEIKAFKAVPV